MTPAAASSALEVDTRVDTRMDMDMDMFGHDVRRRGGARIGAHMLSIRDGRREYRAKEEAAVLAELKRIRRRDGAAAAGAGTGAGDGGDGDAPSPGMLDAVEAWRRIVDARERDEAEAYTAEFSDATTPDYAGRVAAGRDRWKNALWTRARVPVLPVPPRAAPVHVRRVLMLLLHRVTPTPAFRARQVEGAAAAAAAGMPTPRYLTRPRLDCVDHTPMRWPFKLADKGRCDTRGITGWRRCLFPFPAPAGADGEEDDVTSDFEKMGVVPPPSSRPPTFSKSGWRHYVRTNFTQLPRSWERVCWTAPFDPSSDDRLALHHSADACTVDSCWLLAVWVERGSHGRRSSAGGAAAGAGAGGVPAVDTR